MPNVAATGKKSPQLKVKKFTLQPQAPRNVISRDMDTRRQMMRCGRILRAHSATKASAEEQLECDGKMFDYPNVGTAGAWSEEETQILPMSRAGEASVRGGTGREIGQSAKETPVARKNAS